MSGPSEAVRVLSSALEELYPDVLLERYDLTECLGSGHGTETFLAQEKDGGRLCVAKRYDRQLRGLATEGEILGALEHQALPRFYGEFRDERSVWVVRQYIEGMPLDQYMRVHTPSTARVLELCAGLCDVLQYLHSREKPVIHRDIKPQNLIVKPDGVLCLIDFDIAREYNRSSQADTRCLGTRVYAPPEQYGFSQTDGRADIYSFGVLLCWMLTGRTDLSQVRLANPRLAKIIRRCTAFSPQDRYGSAAQVKGALLRAGRHPGGLWRIAGGAAALLAALCIGFVLGRYSPFLAVPVSGAPPSFREPLMEAAARAGLGLSSEEPLSWEALASLGEIYVFGQEVSPTEEPFSQGLAGERGNAPPGRILSLEDIRLLPGLRVLYVNHQALADLSALKGVEGLTRVDLRHTQVSDLSALSGMESLTRLSLYGAPVVDASPLDACPNLHDLEVGGTLISSVSLLGGRGSVTALSLKRLPLLSLEGIEEFDFGNLCTTGTGSGPDPLLRLPHLAHVILDESMREAAQALGPTAFQITYE